MTTAVDPLYGSEIDVDRPRWHRDLAILACLLAALLPAACAAPPRAETSFLTSLDLVDMTSRMAESLAAEEAIVARTPRDPDWVISINRVINHTNQIIPEGQKWAYVGRIRALLNAQRVSRQHALVWVVPPERWPMIAEELGVLGEPADLRRAPTHQLTAEFNVLTTTSGTGRSDAYVCSFQLIDLLTGLIEWEDSWEAMRVVTGVTYD